MDKKIKVGILGAGRIGKLHAENVAYRIPMMEIKTIADPYMNEGMEAWARGIGVDNVTKDPQEVFGDPEIDAVLICSSTDTHAEFIMKAAEAGKHIFCEKPVDHDVDQINRALKAVEVAGVKLQIGFVRRFDHNHKKVRDMVQGGKIGAPHTIKITSRDPEPPPIEYVKVSGGLFFDMMIHDFDMARYLSGSEVVEVYAKAAVLIDPAIGEAGDVDTAVVTLQFANGAIGIIDNSRSSTYGYDQRVEVHGSKGCVQDFNDLPSTTILTTKEGVLGDPPKWFFLERYNEAFAEELIAFADAINGDKEPVVNGADGLKPVLIAEAANISLREGRPVRLDEL
ncbi:inositol 2-dehydrogenase [Anaerotalea alkaliphila]|uniref:Inositol 2-dehydrogenase n=1 Tax=Anaerotalea alkaliphila TaxID=2662126 RepID=A0A7X5KM74_9FIRM|nr:inositol 2-dehydrogenase [Anaerotalea alkaliphila]NDL67504.1 inositol 2-dehydrogenase [Anaerotalea alkaliphila]